MATQARLAANARWRATTKGKAWCRMYYAIRNKLVRRFRNEIKALGTALVEARKK